MSRHLTAGHNSRAPDSANDDGVPRTVGHLREAIEPDTNPGRDRLIVFARVPEPGRVKTRLIPTLGAAAASQLHQSMILRTLCTADRFRSTSGIDVVVYIADGDGRNALQGFGPHFQYALQTGDSLGERLSNAVLEAFREGMHRVLVVGSDCPELDSALLRQASDLLRRADLVLGPALDGGYYLIGMRVYRPELFKGIAWGTEAVLRQTLEAARRCGLKVRLIRPLSDVDYPEDLLVWRRLTGEVPGERSLNRQGVISVVIPVLNEAHRIGPALRRLVDAHGIEVIVADGGSEDGTLEIARRFGVRVVSTRRGRARQMNAGAAVATGELLFFLHADTRPPFGFQQMVLSTMDKECVAGAFRLQIDGDRRGLRLIEWGANLRSRLLQIPYGDQGLFLKTDTFCRVGGFADLPLMEDFEFCRRVRRAGRIEIVPCAVTTSARRWLSLGLVRTTLINQLCVAGYLLGIPPRLLAGLYSQERDGE